MAPQEEQYQSVGKHRGWGLWQLNGKPDYVANMRLALEVKGSDVGDLKGDVDEHMRSRLAAFESTIRPGSKPSRPSGPSARRVSRAAERKPVTPPRAVLRLRH